MKLSRFLCIYILSFFIGLSQAHAQESELQKIREILEHLKMLSEPCYPDQVPDLDTTNLAIQYENARKQYDVYRDQIFNFIKNHENDLSNIELHSDNEPSLLFFASFFNDTELLNYLLRLEAYSNPLISNELEDRFNFSPLSIALTIRIFDFVQGENADECFQKLIERYLELGKLNTVKIIFKSCILHNHPHLVQTMLESGLGTFMYALSGEDQELNLPILEALGYAYIRESGRDVFYNLIKYLVGNLENSTSANKIQDRELELFLALKLVFYSRDYGLFFYLLDWFNIDINFNPQNHRRFEELKNIKIEGITPSQLRKTFIQELAHIEEELPEDDDGKGYREIIKAIHKLIRQYGLALSLRNDTTHNALSYIAIGLGELQNEDSAKELLGLFALLLSYGEFEDTFLRNLLETFETDDDEGGNFLESLLQSYLTAPIHERTEVLIDFVNSLILLETESKNFLVSLIHEITGQNASETNPDLLQILANLDPGTSEELSKQLASANSQIVRRNLLLSHLLTLIQSPQFSYLRNSRFLEIFFENEGLITPGDTFLHAAVRSGHLGVVRFLLESGDRNSVHETLNTLNNEGQSPLCLALRLQNVQISNVLLDHDFSIFSGSPHAVHLVCLRSDRFRELPASSTNNDGEERPAKRRKIERLSLYERMSRIQNNYFATVLHALDGNHQGATVFLPRDLSCVILFMLIQMHSSPPSPIT